MRKVLLLSFLFLLFAFPSEAGNGPAPLPSVSFDRCGQTICAGETLHLQYNHYDLTSLCNSGNYDPCDHIFWVIKDGAGNILEVRYVKLSDYCNGTATGLDFTPTQPGTYCVNGTVMATCQPETILPENVPQTNPNSAGPDCCLQVIGPGISFSFASGSGTYCVGENVCLNFPAGISNLQFNWGDGSHDYVCHSYTVPGTYTITLTGENECGPVSGTQTVTIERCPVPCDIDINVNRSNCSHFEFSVNSGLIIKAWNWTVDGQYVTDQPSFQDDLWGHHEICVTVFATSPLDPSQAICCTQCVTVDVPQFSLIETLDLQYCPIDGNDGIWFSPCDYAWGDDTNYVLTSPGYPPYDSRNGYWWNGILLHCISHHLQAGTHNIQYFDENGCLSKTVIVNVSAKQPTESFCERTVNVDCHLAVNLDGFLPDCPGCADVLNSEFGPWNSIPSIDPNVQIYQRDIVNWATCNKCHYTLRLVKNPERVVTTTINLYPEPCKTIDLRAYMQGCGVPINSGTTFYTYIEGHNGQPNINFTSFRGTTFTLCCQELPPGYGPNYWRVFDLVMPNGCICRLRVQVVCIPYITPGDIGDDTQPDDPGDYILVPNPTPGQFTIQPGAGGEEAVFERVQITDMSGKVVAQYNNVSSRTQFDLTGKPKGMYAITFTGDGKPYQLKLIID